MLVVIFGVLLSGLFGGRWLRTHGWTIPINAAEKLFLPVLLTMIFTLGLSVAQRPELSGNLGGLTQLGWNALCIAVAGMCGSLLLAPLVQRLVARRLRLRALQLPDEVLLNERRCLPMISVPLDEQRQSRCYARRTAVLILTAFFFGALVGYCVDQVLIILFFKCLKITTLLLVMLFIGISIGSDRRCLRIIKRAGAWVLLMPLSIIVGTLLGTTFVAYFLHNVESYQAMTIGAGFGFYSASSMIASQIAGPMLGLMTLLGNLMREILTIALAPLSARYFGPFGPIALGGATTLNSTLPMISLCSGKEYTTLAFFNGLVLTLVVPMLVTIILKIAMF